MMSKLLTTLPCAATLLMTCALQTAVAGPVELKSADGSINVAGELLSFANDIYVVRTDLGDMRVNANKVSCSGTACPVTNGTADNVRLGGSDTIGIGLMPLLSKGFATYLNAAVNDAANTVDAPHAVLVASLVSDQGFGNAIGGLTVTSTRSGDAFTKLAAKNIDIGMSSRRITPDEARALKAAGLGLMVDPNQEHLFAVDSLVMIVNPANPIESISVADIARIYTGQVTNWSELGGPDLAITVVTRPEGSGTMGAFNTRVFGDAPKEMAKNTLIAPSNEAAAQFANDNPGAIAYNGPAFTRGAKVLPIVNECNIREVPDTFAVKAGEYSFERQLYLYTPAETTNPMVPQFIDYISSEGADQVIVQAGFTDFGVAAKAQGADSDRATAAMAAADDEFEKKIVGDLIAQLDGTERLSTTFRFRPGSTKLDPRGEKDLGRLIGYLAKLPAGTKVKLVGFSDIEGEFEPNIEVSKQRADIVAAALAKNGAQLRNITVETLGFGELAPVACNESASGREINRRVEVWVSQG